MKETRPVETRTRQRLSRLGFHFLFVGAFAMLGGALRGFNLLLVLAGLMVGALIMQWRWSRRSIESMAVRRRLPSEAFAGRPFRVRYRLQNRSRMMPSWMIRVEDRIQADKQAGASVAASGVSLVRPGAANITSCDCSILRRGRYRFGPLQVMTCFPFSLFLSRKTIESTETISVYPAILALRSNWRRRLLSRQGGVSTTVRRSGPVEGDFFGLREWQTGDSPKWIHWRTTARINELAVRQFEQQRRFDTCILVDAYQGQGDDPDLVETAISLAATLIVHLVVSPTDQVVLAVAGNESEAVFGGGLDRGKRRMLEVLCEAVPCAQPRMTEAAQKAIKIVGYTQELIVVSSRSMGSVRKDNPELFQGLGVWLRRGALRWIDVGSDLDGWVVQGAVPGASSQQVSESPGKSPAKSPGKIGNELEVG